MPAVARGAIGLAVARGAMQAGSALALGAAQYELVVDAALVTLRRLVALRVAIDAAGALEHRAHRLERGDGVRRRRRGRGGRELRVRAAQEQHDDERARSHLSLSGSERSRCLVKAYTALATAGAIGAVAGSTMLPNESCTARPRARPSGGAVPQPALVAAASSARRWRGLSARSAPRNSRGSRLAAQANSSIMLSTAKAVCEFPTERHHCGGTWFRGECSVIFRAATASK